MKILLLGNYPPSHQYSMLTFTDTLKRGVRAAGYGAAIAAPRSLAGRYINGTSGVGKWLGYFDKFILFPIFLQKRLLWADLVHICDQASSVYITYLRNKPSIVTCHDMLAIRSARNEFTQNTVRFSGRLYQQWILRSLCKVQQVVCVSESTRQDVVRITGLPDDHIRTIPNTLHYPYRPMDPGMARERLNHPGLDLSAPFIIHVGNNNWYKNRGGVLRIYNKFIRIPGFEQYRLVMAGAAENSELRRMSEKLGIANRISWLTDIADEELCALYSLAEALLFPSLYEGFGLPIIEAQACACPVFTSNRPPMNKVAGNAGSYFDPDDVQSAAAVIAEGLRKKNMIIRAGLDNVQRFSIQSVIEAYIELYQTVIEAHSRASHPHN